MQNQTPHYNIVSEIGGGITSKVYKAVHSKTGALVAIKKMQTKKYWEWREIVALREVQILALMSRQGSHPNVVRLIEVIRHLKNAYLVFEWVEEDLNSFIANRAENNLPIREHEIKNITYQCFSALAYLHSLDLIHRDIKPENILVSSGNQIKIADFGLSRLFENGPPYTHYVSTLWYRAPEILDGFGYYTQAVDVWSIGCVMGELFLMKPLFSGENEVDQIGLIMHVLGNPWEDSSNNESISAPKEAIPFSTIIPSASKEAIALLTLILQFLPESRITAHDALTSKWLTGKE